MSKKINSNQLYNYILFFYNFFQKLLKYLDYGTEGAVDISQKLNNLQN